MSNITRIENITDERLTRNIQYVINKIKRIKNEPKGLKDLKGSKYIEDVDEFEEEDENEPIFKRKDSKKRNEKEIDDIKAKFKDQELKDSDDIKTIVMNIYRYLINSSSDDSTHPLFKLSKLFDVLNKSMFSKYQLTSSEPYNYDYLVKKAYLNLMNSHLTNAMKDSLNDALDDKTDISKLSRRVNAVMKKVNASILKNFVHSLVNNISDVLIMLLSVSRGAKYANIKISDMATDVFKFIKGSTNDRFIETLRSPHMSLIFSLLDGSIHEEKGEDEAEAQPPPPPQADVEAEAPAQPQVEPKPKTSSSSSSSDVEQVEVEAPPPPPPQAEPQAQPQVEAQPQMNAEAPGAQMAAAIARHNEEHEEEEQQAEAQHGAVITNDIVTNEPNDSIQAKIVYYMKYIYTLDSEIKNAAEVNNNALFDVMHGILKRFFDLFIGNDNMIYKALASNSLLFDNQESLTYITPESKFYRLNLTIGGLITAYETVAATFNGKVATTEKERLTLPIQLLPNYYRVILRHGRLIGIIPEGNNEKVNNAMVNMEQNKMITELLNSGDLAIISQTPKIDLLTGQQLVDINGTPLYNTMYQYRGVNITADDLHKLVMATLIRDFVRLSSPLLTDAQLRAKESKRILRVRDDLMNASSVTSNLNRSTYRRHKRMPMTPPVRQAYDKKAYMQQFML